MEVDLPITTLVVTSIDNHMPVPNNYIGNANGADAETFFGDMARKLSNALHLRAATVDLLVDGGQILPRQP
jgi:hypothetical protein